MHVGYIASYVVSLTWPDPFSYICMYMVRSRNDNYTVAS